MAMYGNSYIFTEVLYHIASQGDHIFNLCITTVESCGGSKVSSSLQTNLKDFSQKCTDAAKIVGFVLPTSASVISISQEAPITSGFGAEIDVLIVGNCFLRIVAKTNVGIREAVEGDVHAMVLHLLMKAEKVMFKKRI